MISSIRLSRFVANARIGDDFLMSDGLLIERIGETDLAILPGYNDMPIRDFNAAIRSQTFYGKYPIPPADYAEMKFRHMRTMPDLHWRKS